MSNVANKPAEGPVWRARGQHVASWGLLSAAISAGAWACSTGHLPGVSLLGWANPEQRGRETGRPCRAGRLGRLGPASGGAGYSRVRGAR